MINAAGKQAIKNGGPQVTNSFPEGPEVAKCGLGERQIRPARGLPRRKMTLEGADAYDRNRTLTLSRHNNSHRGRRAFRSSPGCEAERAGLPDPWLRWSNSR